MTNNERHKQPDPLLLTVNEVCSRLHLGRCTVYNLIASGKLRSFKVGKARRIPSEALAEYIARELGDSATHGSGAA